MFVDCLKIFHDVDVSWNSVSKVYYNNYVCVVQLCCVCCVCMHTYMREYTSMLVCVCVCVCTCMYMYVRMCVCISGCVCVHAVGACVPVGVFMHVRT